MNGGGYRGETVPVRRHALLLSRIGEQRRARVRSRLYQTQQRHRSVAAAGFYFGRRNPDVTIGLRRHRQDTLLTPVLQNWHASSVASGYYDESTKDKRQR